MCYSFDKISKHFHGNLTKKLHTKHHQIDQNHPKLSVFYQFDNVCYALFLQIPMQILCYFSRRYDLYKSHYFNQLFL